MYRYSLKIPRIAYVFLLMFLIGLFSVGYVTEDILFYIFNLLLTGFLGYFFYIDISKKTILEINSVELRYGIFNVLVIPLQKIFEHEIKTVKKDKSIVIQYHDNETLKKIEINNLISADIDDIYIVLVAQINQYSNTNDFKNTEQYKQLEEEQIKKFEKNNNWILIFTYIFIPLFIVAKSGLDSYVYLGVILGSISLIIDLVFAILFHKKKIIFKTRLTAFSIMIIVNGLFLTLVVVLHFIELFF